MTDLGRLDALAGAATPEEIENFRRTRDWYHGGKGDGVAHGHSDCRLLAAYDAAVRERDALREAAQAVVGPRPRRREWKSITRLRAALHREHVR